MPSVIATLQATRCLEVSRGFRRNHFSRSGLSADVHEAVFQHFSSACISLRATGLSQGTTYSERHILPAGI